MDWILLYAFAAGVVTVLSPCALPLLPVLLSGSTSADAGRPWGIVVGFVGGFLTLLLGFTWLVQEAGLPADGLRWLAGGLLIAFGLLTGVAPLQAAFQRVWSGLVARRPTRRVTPRPAGGFLSGVFVGLGLGLAWSPCVGPIMASVMTLALTQAVDATGFGTAAAFSLGTASVFLVVMAGGRRLLARVPWLTRNLEGLQRGFGVLMVLVGVAILAGWDRDFAAWILRTFPGYGAGLTGWEAGVVEPSLDR